MQRQLRNAGQSMAGSYLTQEDADYQQYFDDYDHAILLSRFDTHDDVIADSSGDIPSNKMRQLCADRADIAYTGDGTTFSIYIIHNYKSFRVKFHSC